MKTSLFLVFIGGAIALSGSLLRAQQGAAQGGVETQPASVAGADIAEQEVRCGTARSLYEQGVVSYTEVLAEDARLIEEKYAAGALDKAEMVSRLQKIYGEQLSLAQARGSKEDALVFQIRLHELSPGQSKQEVLLACYRQLADYKKDKYEHGVGAYDEVLLAEIDYLRASLPGLAPEQVAKTEEEIRQKQDLLKRLHDERAEALR